MSEDVVRFTHVGVWSQTTDQAVTVDAICKELYAQLLKDIYVPKDLFRPVKEKCLIEGTDLTGTSDRMIRKGLYHRTINYPKFTSLLSLRRVYCDTSLKTPGHVVASEKWPGLLQKV